MKVRRVWVRIPRIPRKQTQWSTFKRKTQMGLEKARKIKAFVIQNKLITSPQEQTLKKSNEKIFWFSLWQLRTKCQENFFVTLPLLLFTQKFQKRVWSILSLFDQRSIYQFLSNRTRKPKNQLQRLKNFSSSISKKRNFYLGRKLDPVNPEIRNFYVPGFFQRGAQVLKCRWLHLNSDDIFHLILADTIFHTFLYFISHTL